MVPNQVQQNWKVEGGVGGSGGRNAMGSGQDASSRGAEEWRGGEKRSQKF